MTIIALILSSVIAYAESVTYTYDGLNRLIRAEYEDGTVIQYIYDEAGNQTTLYVDTTPPKNQGHAFGYSATVVKEMVRVLTNAFPSKSVDVASSDRSYRVFGIK